MTQINPYLHFSGNCRAALTFYQHCLGGDLNLMTMGESPMADQTAPEATDHILHGCLVSGALTLMASDMRSDETLASNGSVSLMLACAGEAEIADLFAKLSNGGNVTCPLGPQFWGSIFGAVTDKFGINWLLEYSHAPRALKVEAQGEREIVLTRTFDAPRAAVWNAFSQPKLLQKWWGGGAMTIDQMDFREGGSYRFVTSGPRGEDTFRGEYCAIVPQERIVQTFEWEGMPGHISHETLTLAEHDGQTTMTIRCLFDTPQDRDGMLNSGMEQGAGASYDALEQLLAQSKEPAQA